MARKSLHRGDAAAFRSWYQQALEVATATRPRHVQRLVESQRGIFTAAWDTAELIEHYERLATEYRRDDDLRCRSPRVAIR